MKKFEINGKSQNTKASERYVDVTFFYEHNFQWELSVPIEYRRTGINIEQEDEITSYIKEVYDLCNPKNWEKWRREQSIFWKDKQKKETWELFNILQKTFQWTCITCNYNNSNWARRNQDLKEMGYTIATKLNCNCDQCNQKRRTFILLLPLPRGSISGYEAWNPDLRNKIISVLNNHDVYEDKQVKKESLLPDHKFPEIRWDLSTRRDSLEDLTEEEIKRDFQLMTNQRNLQKREVCRKCYQTGERGTPFGIEFWYEGNRQWDQNIPTTGKEAEKGCIGCGWYDLEKWRKALNEKLNSD